MMDVNEAREYWGQEALEDYRFDCRCAMCIMLEFQDALVTNITCNYFTWGSREWMWEYDDGMILVRPRKRMATIYECPVVWAFEVNF